MKFIAKTSLAATSTILLASLFMTMSAAAYTERTSATFPQPREVLQEGLNPNVGVALGVVNPEGSYKSGAEYGASFAFQPYIPFGLGMSLTFSSNNSSTANVRSLDRTSVLVRGSYHFAGDIPLIKNSFLALATGPVINQNATYFGFAPSVGFDIPVREWSGDYLSYLSIGAEAKYMMVSSDESSALTVNGVLKYWF